MYTLVWVSVKKGRTPTQHGLVISKESEQNSSGLYRVISQTVKEFLEYVAKTDIRLEELETIML